MDRNKIPTATETARSVGQERQLREFAVTGQSEPKCPPPEHTGHDMDQDIPNGTLRVIDGRERSYTDGYWIKTYPVPEDTLQGKRRLIEALTRRLFNHTEHGLDIPDLPLVIGPKANQRSQDLDRLLTEASSLKELLAGATWVGNRRWDLRFRSGETLSLPEGEIEAKAALAKFAHLDGANRLLGRGILRFDMRDPNRFVLRLPHEGQVAPAKLDDARAAVDAVATPASTDCYGMPRPRI